MDLFYFFICSTNEIYQSAYMTTVSKALEIYVHGSWTEKTEKPGRAYTVGLHAARTIKTQ